MPVKHTKVKSTAKSKSPKKTVSRKKSQKGALVKGYLERKSRKGIELLFSEYKEVIGSRSGIYALYKNNKLYYVGIASNLMSRVKTHLKDKHKNSWDTASFFVIDLHKFSKDIETIILRITNAPGNTSKGRFAKHLVLQSELNLVRQNLKNLAKQI